jgi:hypothetical protein
MLQAVTLVLALAAPPLAAAPENAQDSLSIKAELKDVPAQGKEGPALVCEGTANVPNGIGLVAQLYYGTKAIDGKELFSDTAIVMNGKFSQVFPVFPQRNFPGRYVARLIYDPVLQGLNAPNFPRTVVEIPLQIGGPADVDREGQAVRDQLVGEIRALLAIGDQIKAKFDEFRGKPQEDREAVQKEWQDKTLEIRKRVDPRNHREYFILRLDLLADSGMEDLTGIVLSCGRCFVLDQRDKAVEGLTRLRQSCEYWIGEIQHPKLQDVGRMTESLEECRSIARKVLEKPDEPVLPARRRFLELMGILDKSVAADYHEAILGISDRAVAFFSAASDKSPDARKLHAELDGLLERFAATLRKRS